MKITTAELVYINEACKALKQKFCVYIKNVIIGMDDPTGYITFVMLDTNIIQNYCDTGIQFNSSELSKFIKSISIENEFDINDNGSSLLSTYNETLAIYKNQTMINYMWGRYLCTTSIDNKVLVPEEDVSKDLEQLFTMHKPDGGYNHIYHGYFMTLFAGLLPLNKSDKIREAILKYPNTFQDLFISRFTVIKKKFTVYVYCAFRKIPKP